MKKRFLKDLSETELEKVYEKNIGIRCLTEEIAELDLSLYVGEVLESLSDYLRFSTATSLKSIIFDDIKNDENTLQDVSDALIKIQDDFCFLGEKSEHHLTNLKNDKKLLKWFLEDTPEEVYEENKERVISGMLESTTSLLKMLNGTLERLWNISEEDFLTFFKENVELNFDKVYINDDTFIAYEDSTISYENYENY